MKLETGKVPRIYSHSDLHRPVCCALDSVDNIYICDAYSCIIHTVHISEDEIRITLIRLILVKLILGFI